MKIDRRRISQHSPIYRWHITHRNTAMKTTDAKQGLFDARRQMRLKTNTPKIKVMVVHPNQREQCKKCNVVTWYGIFSWRYC